jgi:hypothetical protein
MRANLPREVSTTASSDVEVQEGERCTGCDKVTPAAVGEVFAAVFGRDYILYVAQQ